MEAQASSYPAPVEYKVDVGAREYREGYREYYSVLRSWLIAFGIGYRRNEIRCRAREEGL